MQVARTASTSSRRLWTLLSPSSSSSFLPLVEQCSSGIPKSAARSGRGALIDNKTVRFSSTVAARASVFQMTSPSLSLDIEDLHRQAVAQGANTYIDPETGFTVFTEFFHLKRGSCCGCHCRHCPYGWANVRKTNMSDSESDSESVQQKQQQQLQRKKEVQKILKYQADQDGGNPSVKNSSEQLSKRSTGGRKGGTLTSKNVPYTRTGDNGTSQLLNGERRFKTDAAFEAMGTIDELCSFVGVVHAQLMATTTVNNNNSLNEGNDDDKVNNNNNKATTEMYGELPEWLLEIMSRLFDIGSQVANPARQRDGKSSKAVVPFSSEHTIRLEEWIDQMTDILPELSSFILPTGTVAAAHLHVARTVCRRAERRVVKLQQQQQQQRDDKTGDNDDDTSDEEKEHAAVVGEQDVHMQRYLNRLSDFFFTAARFVNYCEKQPNEIQYRREYRGTKQRQRVMAPLSSTTATATSDESPKQP